TPPSSVITAARSTPAERARFPVRTSSSPVWKDPIYRVGTTRLRRRDVCGHRRNCSVVATEGDPLQRKSEKPDFDLESHRSSDHRRNIPVSTSRRKKADRGAALLISAPRTVLRSEEHTSELQSRE